MLNLTQLPSCSIPCLINELSQSLCSPTNETCLCIDPGYNAAVTQCVLTNCTSVKDQLTLQRAAALNCNVPVETDIGGTRIMFVTVFSVQTAFFLLRMTSRLVRLVSWGWDDTTIVISWLFTVGFFAASIVEETLGLGKPYWAWEFWQIDTSLLVYYVFQIIYTINLGMIKISICFLYIRIFRDNPKFQRIMWGTQVFNVLVVLAFVGADLGQCQPLNYFWQGWDNEHQGRCYNINALSYAHAGINLALDAWMLFLPATQVWTLNLSRERKLGISMMFGCGIFLTAASIIRMTTLPTFGRKATDWTSYFDTAVWSFVELSVGVIVACLPAARIVFRRYAGPVTESTGLRNPTQTRPLSNNSGHGPVDSRYTRRWTRALQLPTTTRSTNKPGSSWFHSATAIEKGTEGSSFVRPLKNELDGSPGPTWVMKDLTEEVPGSPRQPSFRPEGDVGYSVSIQYRSP